MKIVPREHDEVRQNRSFWLSRPADERVAAISILRRLAMGVEEENFGDFVSLLLEHGVAFLVVGGYAVGHHGAPRATGDIDFWIEPTLENAQKMREVYNRFAGLDMKIEDLISDDILQLGVPPVRIDLLKKISGVSWSEAWECRKAGTLFGRSVFFIGYDTLIKNKRAAGRKKDEADLEALGDR